MFGSLYDKPFMQQMLHEMKPGLRLFNGTGGTGGGGGGGTGGTGGGGGGGTGGTGGQGTGGTGGGGTGGTGGQGTGGTGGDANAALLAEIKAMRAEITELKKSGGGTGGGTGGQGGGTGGDGGDKTLADRVEAERKLREKNQADANKIERDISYNFGIKKFCEDHKPYLSENILEIINEAEKEKFGNAAEKASTLRTEIIDAFFKVQANSDILTAAQKRLLADFGKLTKDGKRQDSEKVYESVFEPALEMVKRVKKAEELNLAARGYATATGGPLGAYKQKLFEAAKRVIINKRERKAG